MQSRGRAISIACRSGCFHKFQSRSSWLEGFAETLPQRIDRLEEEGSLGPAIWVFPETFTSLGGNQFVDSDAIGHWATWLHTDLISAIEANYPVRQAAFARALFGKSSGGFGALHQALNHGEFWGAVACHSGDMGFELGYSSDLAHALLYLEQQGSDVPGALKESGQRKGWAAVTFSS